jgi:16S rRNA (cytosine967-C5)-methyltransferase
VQKTANRDLSKSTPEIRAALVLGTYQIFYMDRIPDRAAVNESAEYIRVKKQANAVSFVNGILRSIARRSAYFAKPDKEKQPVEYLAMQYAHPKWMISRWHNRFNFEKLKNMLAANNQPPPYSVRINSLKTPLEMSTSLREMILREEKNHAEQRTLRSSIQLKQSPNFGEGSLFQQGYFTVQDEVSQIIGLIVDPREGEVIIDACCGPAGKLSHLYELVKGKATLIGIDSSAPQLARARENFVRLGFEMPELIEQDYLAYQPEKPVDRILLDAPCSGLGVIRRHPEGKWQKNPAIVDKVVKKQRTLIAHALSMLASGGELIYSVCSFEYEETLGQLEWAKAEYGDAIELVHPGPRLPDYFKKYLTREHIFLVFSDNKENMDGFGAFILKKK